MPASSAGRVSSDPLVGDLERRLEPTDQGIVWSVVPLQPPLSFARLEAGGDEETRTPDPLLAKEMLFQLSYVPADSDGAESGGRFWTRTRDLCLIRAVL